MTTATAPLTRTLRARQAAHRCETKAAHHARLADAARTPQGRQEHADLAAGYAATAAEWRAVLAALEPAEPTRLSTCGSCGGTATLTNFGWAHAVQPRRFHAVDPDDGYAATADDEEPADPDACSCGGDHTEDEHDSLAALDEDADRH